MIQVRSKVYRGVPGYAISGTWHDRYYSVYTRYIDLAERVRAAIKRGDLDDVEASIWAEERRRMTQRRVH